MGNGIEIIVLSMFLRLKSMLLCNDFGEEKKNKKKDIIEINNVFMCINQAEILSENFDFQSLQYYYFLL